MRKSRNVLHQPTRHQPAIIDALEPRTFFSRGVTGTYFTDPAFTLPSRINVDRRIDFGPLAPAVEGAIGDNSVEQSARWTGQVLAKFSEYYTFYVQTNGSVRLWVNDKLVVEEPTNAADHEFAAKMKVKFIAGQLYNVRLDYVDQHGDQGYVRLLWSSTRTLKTLLPESRLRATIKPAPKIRISFRPVTAEQPSLYRYDNGLPYGSRGLGYYYGWDQDNSANLFDRDSSRSFSERYDAGALMDLPNGQKRYWHIKVPNGAYNVRVVAGDADNGLGAYSIDVEGRRVIRGHPNQFSYWFDGTATVNVTDGDIMVSPGFGSNKSRINFVEITPARDSDRLIAFWPVGNASLDPATRTVAKDQFTNGWTGWVQSRIPPLLAQGYTRIHLHNPFGVGTHMELDQYLLAKEQGLTWLTDDFVSAWKPITAKGVEVIAYIGMDKGEPQFGTTEAQWFARFWAAVKPLLDAKVSIALDSACLQPEQSYVYKAAQLLRARDVKVYIESRQMKANEQWGNFAVFSEESWWHDSDPANSTDAANWALPTDQITGEVVRWVFYPPEGYDWDDPGWRVPQILSVLKDGDTVATYPNLDQDSVDLFWLLARANGYLGATA
jgi:hypothetical protein